MTEGTNLRNIYGGHGLGVGHMLMVPGPRLPLENCLNPISPGKGPGREEVGMPLGGSWGLPGVGGGWSGLLPWDVLGPLLP